MRDAPEEKHRQKILQRAAHWITTVLVAGNSTPNLNKQETRPPGMFAHMCGLLLKMARLLGARARPSPPETPTGFVLESGPYKDIWHGAR